ncbi:hypothetical protein DO021_03250 [Desulfobacter hydrogenophilus]|uniref:Uncharacterized protein n=1 Tax=Desulfobacter hydrogenophilus TaxID=2291 RepID=A0A328FKK4_9BACT|nr:hypothetical protein [Desulfobacter hydrogenophilus]NDY71401.1 hypothetical protein [Desulfobacter hydrogenophilus]QBH12141.1 hypothetical protein EYB58_03880 [Desulfobacter hydrogenophilus]RAM03537.1 hypothetical protein DO021_03250 [Desulfobacter hydrogenophilus]
MKKKIAELLIKSALILTLSIAVVGLPPAIAGNKKLMTIQAAKVLAERAIVESVIGLKIKTTERVENMVATHQRIDAKTAASIKGIQYSDIVYDKAKDIAKVTARINLGRVTTIIGKRINWGDRTIERVAFATSTEANAGPLKALRAAELDAYSQLAKQIVGFNLQSKTSVENYIMKNDEARTRLLAAIYGAKLVGYRWDAEGDAYVKLALTMGEVDDILGQRINYNGTIIEVEGSGAQTDDFSEANSYDDGNTGSSMKIGTSVKEGNLDIPVNGQSTPTVEQRIDYPAGGSTLQ